VFREIHQFAWGVIFLLPLQVNMVEPRHDIDSHITIASHCPEALDVTEYQCRRKNTVGSSTEQTDRPPSICGMLLANDIVLPWKMWYGGHMAH